MQTKDFSDRIWSGDQKTLLEAQRKFVTGNFEVELLPYASVLYSFRHLPECAEDLIQLRGLMMRRVEDLCSQKEDWYYGSHWLDRIDMLSTYLAWMSSRSELSDEEREKVRAHALSISGSIVPGFLEEYYTSGEPRLHSYYLILLTYASLQPNSSNARIALGHVMRGAHDVQDRKQRVRVYAKLGVQLRAQVKSGGLDYWFQGIGWGIRACLVPFVPLNVRMKAAASLLGVTA